VLIFLDVETTGLEIDDKICSIGMVTIEDEIITTLYELVNEGKKISPKASSINHITNEMIKAKPKLKDSDIYKFLEKHNSVTTTIIGHNVNFDLERLSAAGFIYKGNIIDTLRVSKHLIPECESYSLQFLRYELKLYKNEVEKITAHNAISDALVVKMLYDYLLDIKTKDEMCELSFKKVLLEKFEFGKYSGKYIEEICMNDRGYLDWMMSQVVDLDEDLRYSIDYYLRG